MGARKYSNVVSIAEYMYSKYDPIDLKLENATKPKKKQNIRSKMIKGYLEMLSNQIK